MAARVLLRRIIAVAVMATGLAACDGLQNVSILEPEANGLTCVSETICLERLNDRAEAEALYAEAAVFVTRRIAPFETPPRVLFCRTTECFARFSGEGPRAVNLGTFGIVVGPRGWINFIVRHEMIHHVQNERFGVWRASQTLPQWYVEGMAYALSDDPRRPLPSPRIEQYRAQFEAWIAQGNTWQVPPG